MRVTFNAGDERKLRAFFKGDVEFLDFMVTRDALFIISNTKELYCHWTFEIITREDYTEDLCFRVDRDKFLSLVSKGSVSVLAGYGDKIHLDFKTEDGNSYSIEQLYQASDRTVIDLKWALLRNSSHFESLNLMSLETALPLVKQVSQFVNVEDGILTANKKDMWLFYKTECKNVNLFGHIANHLINFSERIYSYQDYVIGQGPSVLIIAKQSFVPAQSPYEYIRERNIKIKMELSMSSICELVDKASLNSDVILDFDKQIARVLDGRDRYETKIKVSNVQKGGSQNAKDEDIFAELDNLDLSGAAASLDIATMPKLLVSAEAITTVLKSLTKRRMTLKIKKEFIQFEADKITFVVGRREANAGL